MSWTDDDRRRLQEEVFRRGSGGVDELVSDVGCSRRSVYGWLNGRTPIPPYQDRLRRFVQPCTPSEGAG